METTITIIIVVCVSAVIIIGLCIFIYRRKSNNSVTNGPVPSNSSQLIVIKNPGTEPLSEPLPEQCRGIILYKDTQIVCPKDKEAKPFTKNVAFDILNLGEKHMKTLARFISNGYVYSFTQVYEEDGQLYLYDVYRGYCMLIVKGSSVTEYNWPKQSIFEYDFLKTANDDEMHTRIDLASEKRNITHPNYHFKVNGTKYVCNMAYAKSELEKYIGLCDKKTPMNYYSDTNSKIMGSDGNEGFIEYIKEPILFYKVMSFNGTLMDIEPIIDVDILSMVNNGTYDVFGIYKECNRLFIFDHDAKRHMPIIWSLKGPVVNRLTLHQPYFRNRSTELKRFERPVDILCIPDDHWVVIPGYKPDERYVRGNDGSVNVNEGDRLYVGLKSKKLVYAYRCSKAENLSNFFISLNKEK
jgi:hypothetical protein